MDKKILDQQSQYWEKNFSSKPEMFGLESSIPAKKSLELFKKQNITKIIELGAGLGRDTIFFAQNSIFDDGMGWMDGDCGRYFFVLGQKKSILDSKNAGKHVSVPAEPL